MRLEGNSKDFYSDTNNSNSRKELSINLLKKKLYKHITDKSNYPEWKQINYLEKKVLGIDLVNVDSVIQWKSSLLSQLDTIINDINNSSTNAELKLAVKSMVFTSPPFKL